jgi:hypothetical protein
VAEILLSDSEKYASYAWGLHNMWLTHAEKGDKKKQRKIWQSWLRHVYFSKKSYLMNDIYVSLVQNHLNLRESKVRALWPLTTYVYVQLSLCWYVVKLHCLISSAYFDIRDTRINDFTALGRDVARL